MRKHLFVMGCDRSGTTAFVDLLNSHPRLCIGMERYKHYVSTPERLTPALFEPEEFFNLRTDQTNIKWDRIYKALRPKYETAAYVGDKVPRYFTILEDIRRQFPSCQFVFLARDPYDVARSWKRRAMDPNDHNWPRSHGVERAIAVWNSSLSAYRAAAKIRCEDLFFLRYEAIFSRDTSSLAKLLNTLGLDFHPDMQRHFEATLAAWEQKKRPDEVLTDAELQWVEKNANQRLFERIAAEDPAPSNAELGEPSQQRPDSPNVALVLPQLAVVNAHRPSVIKCRGAHLVPWRIRADTGTEHSDPPFVGGVVDASGKAIPAARIQRHGRNIAEVDGESVSATSSLKIEGPAFFGGYLFRQYGHFLLESLSRLWAWTPEFDGPIVFLGSSGFTHWQKHILRLLGVTGELKLVGDRTEVEELVIPEAGFEIGGQFHALHRDFLARVQCLPGATKLWLSRSALGDNMGGVEGEKELEERLAGRGWTIFRPEQHSVEEQLAALAGSARIAGWEGSAFHTLILLKDSRAKIDLFIRGRTEAVAPQYEAIAQAKGLDQRVHKVSLFPIGGERRGRRYRVVDERKLNQVLMMEENNATSQIPAPQRDRDWTSRRINKLAQGLNAKTYLEIGVRHGRTFLKVQVPMRDGVDPEFAFDTNTHASDSTRLFPVTSDEFFVSPNVRRHYDLMFIDGLHTFEQTFRDFVSCLSLAHERSVLLIDDTVPSDIFSAIPDASQALKLRAASGSPSKAWHGDVYKLVFAIHDFFPMLDFATVTDRGNPQTFVWRGTRKQPFRPKFGSLEAISRTSYTDFVDNRKLLNLVTEEEALRVCLSGVVGDK